MAVAVETVGAWRVVSNGVATSGVRCGVEPTRTVQQVVFRRADVAVLAVASSGDVGARLRCRAGTLTAVRGLATADGVLEREGAMRCVKESRAALRDSFEAAFVSGRAVCAGTDESRNLSNTAGAESAVDMAAEAVHEQRRIYYGRRGGGDAYPGMATTKPANTEEGVRKGVSGGMAAACEAALQGAGRNAEMLCQLAMRAWRKLGDADRAEQLYMKALQLAPQDSAIQASYAQFLWQCDA